MRKPIYKITFETERPQRTGDSMIYYVVAEDVGEAVELWRKDIGIKDRQPGLIEFLGSAVVRDSK